MQGKRILTLEQLQQAAHKKRSVYAPSTNAWNDSRPAAFIINLHGNDLLRLIEKGLYLYEIPGHEKETTELIPDWQGMYFSLKEEYEKYERKALEDSQRDNSILHALAKKFERHILTCHCVENFLITEIESDLGLI